MADLLTTKPDVKKRDKHERFRTVKEVEKFQPAAARVEHADDLLAGLYLVVQPSGVKSWAVRYRNAAGAQRKLTLGGYPAISLSEAREEAKVKLRAVQEGADPATEKKAERAEAPARTFEALALRFIKRHAKQNRRWTESARILGYGPDEKPLPAGRVNYCADWQGRAIDSIRRRDVVNVLDTIEDDNGRTMANRVLACLRTFFGWVATIDDEYVSPIVKGMTRGKPVKRDRVLSDDEIRKLWPLLDRTEFRPSFGPACKVLLLTARRREEVNGMRWAEIDEEAEGGPVWRLPRASKSDAAETVPLSPAVMAILKAQTKNDESDLVFATERGKLFATWGKAKAELDKVAEIPAWRIHDLRRTARTIMARAGIRREIAERVLGHVVQGVEGVYDRHGYLPERRHALETLAAEVAAILNPPTDKVLKMRKGA